MYNSYQSFVFTLAAITYPFLQLQLPLCEAPSPLHVYHSLSYRKIITIIKGGHLESVCGRLYLHKSGLSRHMRKEEQPASTCCQCGKAFNRKDNMLIHLQDCTDHRPQQHHHQQQQHTTAAPPTFTISHRYSSEVLGNATVSIQEQETHDLDQLSPALTSSHQRWRPSKPNTTPTSLRLSSGLCVTKRWTRVLSHNHQLP